MKVLLAAAALASTLGCVSPEPYALQRTAAVITVAVDPSLPVNGEAQWTGAVRKVTLREYPTCLAHEVRHCFEGHWHGDAKSAEDCE